MEQQKPFYNHDAQRRGNMAQYQWDQKLNIVEQYRRQFPKFPNTNPYSAATNYQSYLLPLLEELGEEQNVPSYEDLKDMERDEMKSAIQRAMTILRNRLHTDGGGGGDGQGQSQPQQGQGKPQEQKSEQKAQASPSKQEGQQSQGKGQKTKEEPEEEPEDEDEDEGSGEEESDDDFDGDPEDEDWEDDDSDVADELELTDEESTPGNRQRGGSHHSDVMKASTKGPHSGGGDQYRSSKPTSSLFYAVRAGIQKITDGFDQSQVDEEGDHKWNARRVFRSARWNQQRLPQAQDNYLRVVENVYLILDTSGSVAQWAEQIAAFAAGAAGYVHLFTGTEARPHFYVPRKTPLGGPQEPFPEWKYQEDLRIKPGYADFVFNARKTLGVISRSFEEDFIWWEHLIRPPKGSRLVFWGDTQGVGFEDLRILKKIFSPYRVTWLCPNDRNMWRRYHGNLNPMNPNHVKEMEYAEYIKLQHIGIPVFFEVVTPEAFRGVIGKLK